MALRLILVLSLAVALCTVREAGGAAVDGATQAVLVDSDPSVSLADEALVVGHASCSNPLPDVTQRQPSADRAPSSPDARRVFRPPRPAFG